MEIPILGFGTWKMKGDEAEEAVATALEVGYRHIDTAWIYENQTEVGRAVRENGVIREKLWITSKLWHDYLARDQVRPALEKTLDELRMEYLDLYLIHWPNREVPIEETMEELGKLKEEGRIREIGVSNFTQKHMERALATGVKIANNQIELHPTFNQKEIRKYCRDKGISVTAYSPVGHGKDLEEEIVVDLANKYGVSSSQIILAWLRQNEIIAVPKASSREHIEENWKSLQVNLTDEDLKLMETIDQLPRQVNPGFAEFEE